MIGFDFTSDWMRKRHKFFQVTKGNNEKLKQIKANYF